MAKNPRIEQIEEFLKKTPDDAFLQYALATEYVALGQDNKAHELFVKLTQNRPKYFATYYHLAKLYERQGKIDLAEQTYEKGIDICTALKEQHALRELRSAYDELRFD